MGNKLLYGILFIWMKAHAMLPLSVLYILSDVLYVLVYRVVRYRLKVVRTNMKESFPEKSPKELKQLERDFYHHFCDYIVETLKLGHISYEEVTKRAYMENPELLAQLLDEGPTCLILMMGHYGNWEWYTHAERMLPNTCLRQIYRPLKNKAFDDLFIYLRTRFGAKGIKKKDTIRDIIGLVKEGKKSLVIFLADQTPSGGNIHYWSPFLNHLTPVLDGGERIARKQKMPVVFLDVKKVRRGYYSLEVKLITDKPQETPEHWITEQYTRHLENMILRNPAYWLWTHKRWKFKKEDI